MAKHTLCSANPTQNQKVANKGSKNVYATYRALEYSCPSSCALKGHCYASLGYTNLVQRKAEYRNDNVTDYIKSLPKESKLRNLVSGDLFLDDIPDYEYITELNKGLESRPDIRSWGYTHDAQSLVRTIVNKQPNNCINASCDTEEQLLTNLDNGWDCVKVVDKSTPKVVYTESYKQVVCPAQQQDKMTCESCMLCAKQGRKDKDGLPIVIAFYPHGVNKKRVWEIIEDNQNEN